MRREHAQARPVWPALRKEIFYNKYVNVLYRVVEETSKRPVLFVNLYGQRLKNVTLTKNYLVMNKASLFLVSVTFFKAPGVRGLEKYTYSILEVTKDQGNQSTIS